MAITSITLGLCCASVALMTWTAPTVLAAWSAVRQPSTTPERLVEHVVVVLAAAALASLVLWLAVSLLVCTVDVLRGADAPARQGLFRPRLARALVAGALGTLVATGAPGATGASHPHEPALPRALDGLSVPDRPYGVVRTHRVRAGESLWSITAGHLQDGAPAAAVDRRWPQLHRLNRDRTGRDPHLIHPGTHLRLPTWGAAPTRGVTR